MKKGMVVILVVAIGIGGAMLFRKSVLQSEGVPQEPANIKSAFEARQTTPAIPLQGVPGRPKDLGNTPSGSQQAANKPQKPEVLNRSTRPPLPTLSDFGSQTDRQAGPRTVNRGQGTPPKKSPERYHVIVNGDTLARIAQRYLGDGQRGEVILRWNREIIRDPTQLPLGKKLRIPSIEDLATDPTATTRHSDQESQSPPAPLVPLRRAGTSDG